MIPTGPRPRDQSPWLASVCLALALALIPAGAGLAALGGDTLYVTEHTAGRLIRIDLASGRRETVLEGLDRPEGLTVIDATHVAVVETGKRQLLRVATDSGVAERIATDLPIGLSSPFGPDDPYIPTDVVATSAGEFYVSSDLANTVLRITRE